MSQINLDMSRFVVLFFYILLFISLFAEQGCEKVLDRIPDV